VVLTRRHRAQRAPTAAEAAACAPAAPAPALLQSPHSLRGAEAPAQPGPGPHPSKTHDGVYFSPQLGAPLDLADPIFNTAEAACPLVCPEQAWSSAATGAAGSSSCGNAPGTAGAAGGRDRIAGRPLDAADGSEAPAAAPSYMEWVVVDGAAYVEHAPGAVSAQQVRARLGVLRWV